ncbi:MAG: heat-inducible transcriptional repressor HrcA [Rickettsiales bacterium]|nr:heat-inducible transcriptional repressor HrcA [Rickettsiales bacterium]|tara:strand:+ start:69765 stop:70817 length:1053 start_codon:yes stop_codon:yes gene_type:complete
MELILNNRSLEIFKSVVDAYIDTGEPIGSKVLSERLGMKLSSATIRNVMANLEEVGLLYAPHVSAGRLPTEKGLKFFVHGMLEVGDLATQEKRSIEEMCGSSNLDIDKMLDQACRTLSGLSGCAGLVMAPKQDAVLKHVEFVSLDTNKVLAILVSDQGDIENRLITLPAGFPPAKLVEASNFLNAHYVGRTLAEIQAVLSNDVDSIRKEIDSVVHDLVEKGLAKWVETYDKPTLILTGHSNLLSDVTDPNQLENIKRLFEVFERRTDISSLLDASMQGEGVQIFIGSDNHLFDDSGCSMIVAPYANASGRVFGSLGVVGPTRLNYARIIPMVDYTAKIIGRLISMRYDTR